MDLFPQLIKVRRFIVIEFDKMKMYRNNNLVYRSCLYDPKGKLVNQNHSIFCYTHS